MSTWTQERVETLKELWASGMSATQVAAQLGGVSRSAVLGKAHRCGFPAPTKPHPQQNRQRVRRPRKPSDVPTHARITEPREFVPAEPVPETDQLIPLDQRRSLLELTEETCRWPVGDPAESDFFFCGAKPIDGLPYCGRHAGVAYPPKPAKRPKAAVPESRSLPSLEVA